MSRIAPVFALALVSCAAPPGPEPRTPPSPPPAAPAPIAVTSSAEAEPAPIPESIRAALAAPDRSDADRALDAGRKSDQVLAFFGIAPGMKVAELGAGGGYTAELLARIVGSGGTVYGQNNQFILERFADKPWSERLATPAMKNVVRVDREFDDPLPPEAKDLDAVTCILFYHDTVWMKTDRAKMNRAIFDALKHGGVFGIVDHAAAPGAGIRDVQTLHRIEKSVVVDEVKAAGFELAGESNILANPKDAHDWNDSPRAAADRRGTSDRFVLKFVKP